MKLRIGLLMFFGAVVFLSTKAQDSASTPKKPGVPFRPFHWGEPHSPKNAAFYAAVLPGLGQIYNHKYWKTPIVYAGLGVSTYSMLYFREKKRKLDKEFKAAYAKNADTTISAIRIDERDQFRRYRDISILAMSAFYILQIVDATVDAHFYHMDIDQNLEARIQTNPTRFLTFTYRF